MPRAPLTILLVVTRLNIGGPAVQVITLAGALPARGFRTVLVSGSLPAGEGDMSYIADPLRVRPVYIPALSREIAPFRDLKALLHLLRWIRRIRPDVVHTHTAKAGTVGRMAAILGNGLRLSGKRMRIVHTFHGHTFYGYFGRGKTLFFKIVERVLSRFTDRIVVISPSQQEDICRKFAIAPRHRVRVVPLGLDLSRFAKTPEHQDRDALRRRWFPGAQPDALIVGSIGRLTDIKNPGMVLSVARILEGRGVGERFRFLMVGDGELRSHLVEQVRRSGMETTVAFSGWQQQIESIYAALDAVILTSINEGTPVSLIEAMASGTPVVATEVGGVVDLMGREKGRSGDGFRIMENGILVPSKDAPAMAAALIHLQENREHFATRAMKNNAAVVSRFSVDRVVESHRELYQSLFS